MKQTIRLILILFIILSTLKSHAQSEVEKLAYSKFIGGFDIDLLFESNDTISGDFLVKLILTDSLNNKSNKLSLKNAVVVGRVDLASKKIDKEISFYNVQFINEVNFENTTVENDLTLRSCEFNKINISEGTILGHLILDYSKFVQKADFHLIQVKRNFLLRHTNFYSDVDLGSAIIGNFLVFNSAKFHAKSRLNLNSSKVRSSLQLKNAIFDCPVNGSYMEIGSNFDAPNCKFQSTESVVFHDLKVKGWLKLTNSTFNGIFDLKYSKIESDVNFRNSIFNSELDFYYASFGLGRFQNVQFNSDSALIDFKNVNTTSDLSFTEAVFNSRLRLSNANIGGNLNLWKVISSGKSLLTGEYSKINGSVIISNAEIRGDIDFSDCEINKDLICYELSFLNNKKEASFSSSKILGSVLFQGSTFLGKVDFEDSEISSELDFTNSKFSGSSSVLSLNNLSIHKNVFMNDCQFYGRLDMTAVKINGQFQFQNTIVHNTQKEKKLITKASDISFNSLNAGSCFFDNSTFYSTPNFRFINVKSLRLNGVKFLDTIQLDFTGSKIKNYITAKNLSSHPIVNFTNVDVGMGILLDSINLSKELRMDYSNCAYFKLTNSSLTGPLNFQNSEFKSEIEIGNIHDANNSSINLVSIPHINNVKFYGFHIGKILVADSKILNNLSISGVNIDSLTLNSNSSKYLKIDKLNIQKSIEFTELNIGTLFLNDLSYSYGKSNINNVNYSNYIDGKSHSMNSTLIKLIDNDNSNYSTEYETLINFYNSNSQSELADKIHMHKMKRESGSTFLKRMKNYFLYLFIGNGKKPQRAFIWILLLIIGGTFLFRKKKMQLVNEDNSIYSYSSLIYSLDLFLPFINLQSADIWIPKQEHKFLRVFMRIYSIIGWILIPLALASITGLIK